MRVSARQIRELLIEEKGCIDEELPKRQTLSTILNQMGYRLQKVKNKPLKKIPETDAIFEQIHKINKEADRTDGVIRPAMDSKAVVKLGPYSRGGRNRIKVEAADHDFDSPGTLTPFSILLLKYDELFISFTESKITSDFIWDCVEALWPELNAKYSPENLVFNPDNGPENHSGRT